MTLNAPILHKEILDTIHAFPKNNSTGTDGFSSEYYKAFSQTLVPYLSTLFNSVASSSSFPEEMLQATIVTLPKPGKKPDTPQNFRPISVWNTDLKIYAKILANRLAAITLCLVKADQVGFVKVRQAPGGTRRLFNLLHILETRGTPVAFLALDAEKAFDRVHWGYLKAIVHKFGL